MPEPDRACALNCRGHLCCADDRHCLPVCSDFTCSCVSSFAAVLGVEATENILFVPSVVWFFFPPSVLKDQLVLRQVWWAEGRDATSETVLGDRSQKLILESTSSCYGCVLAEIALLLPSKFTQQRSRCGGKCDTTACALYCPNTSPVHVEAAQHVLVWCSLAHRAPLLMALYWGKYAAWLRVTSGIVTRGRSRLDIFWKWH